MRVATELSGAQTQKTSGLGDSRGRHMAGLTHGVTRKIYV